MNSSLGKIWILDLMPCIKTFFIGRRGVFYPQKQEKRNMLAEKVPVPSLSFFSLENTWLFAYVFVLCSPSCKFLQREERTENAG